MSDTSTNTTKLLSEIIQEISSLLSVEEIIEKVYQNVNVLMDASVFAIGIYESDTNRLCYPADMEKGKKLPVNYDSLNDNSRLSVRCFTTKKEIIINDFLGDYHSFFPEQEIPMPIAGEQTESIIYLPLLIRNHP